MLLRIAITLSKVPIRTNKTKPTQAFLLGLAWPDLDWAMRGARAAPSARETLLKRADAGDERPSARGLRGRGPRQSGPGEDLFRQTRRLGGRDEAVDDEIRKPVYEAPRRHGREVVVERPLVEVGDAAQKKSFDAVGRGLKRRV